MLDPDTYFRRSAISGVALLCGGLLLVVSGMGQREQVAIGQLLAFGFWQGYSYYNYCQQIDISYDLLEEQDVEPLKQTILIAHILVIFLFVILIVGVDAIFQKTGGIR